MRGWMIVCTLLALALAIGCAPSGVAAGEASGGEAGPLEGTEWSLVEVGGQPARAAGTAGTPTLRLDAAQKRAMGNTGCNSYGGPYELSGESLRFGALASTRRACVDEELNRQESAYMRALDETRTWRITGSTLVLSGESGVVARFAAQPAG
ncbi:MAG: META domain-containing protein [Longimicrobiaceae bacterium]